MSSSGGGQSISESLLAKKASENSGNAADTFGKLLLLGNIDAAAKTYEGLTGNLQNAISQLTQPVNGIASAISQHPTSVVGKLFGDQAQLNMSASVQVQEVVGDVSAAVHSSVDGGGISDSGDFSSQSAYNPHTDSNLEDAGHKILSASSEQYSGAEHSMQHSVQFHDSERGR